MENRGRRTVVDTVSIEKFEIGDTVEDLLEIALDAPALAFWCPSLQVCTLTHFVLGPPLSNL